MHRVVGATTFTRFSTPDVAAYLDSGGAFSAYLNEVVAERINGFFFQRSKMSLELKATRDGMPRECRKHRVSIRPEKKARRNQADRWRCCQI